MSNEYEFDLRHLYSQQTLVEGDNYVECRAYAISYLYPGAISRISGRCRVTAVYRIEGLDLIINGGTIEKWTDKGWIVVEEFFDTAVEFKDTEAVFEYMTTLYKSFLLGIPVTTGASRSPVPPKGPSTKEKNPKLRVLSFKDKSSKLNDYKKKNNSNAQDQNNNTSSDDNDDDSPDFDWI